MDTYPITARSLGLYFKLDGNNLERAYKDHLSGFRHWEQASHAENWVLHPENIGKRLGIDETMLHKDLMTFLTNKEGHGKRHTLIAAVKGTKASDIVKVLMQIPQERREQVEEVTMTLICSLRSVFSNKSIDRVTAKVKLHEWYQKVSACTLREVKAARDAIKYKEEEVLNYFINRSTNAHAESLNSKLKGFRAQLRGVQDLPFFMFRTSMIFG